MSEMVERVAEAVKELAGNMGTHFDDYVAIEIARAAIRSMREPTGRMISHGEEKFSDSRSVDHSDELADAFRAMIDAALGNPPLGGKNE